jgi:hypothetical protein
MEHVVFSAAQDGAGEEFRRVASLEEAIRVVEHLRNDLGITDPSVFALTPVPVAFRTYYRVEVPGLDEEATEPASSSLELEPAELPHADAAIEDSESLDSVDADSDMSEYVFDGNSDMEVPGILPDASAIPASRQDHDADKSLGYFAR